MPNPSCFGITKKGEQLYREVFGDEVAERIIDAIDPRPKKMLFDYTRCTPYPGSLQTLVAEHTNQSGGSAM